MQTQSEEFSTSCRVSLRGVWNKFERPWVSVIRNDKERKEHLVRIFDPSSWGPRYTGPHPRIPHPQAEKALSQRLRWCRDISSSRGHFYPTIVKVFIRKVGQDAMVCIITTLYHMDETTQRTRVCTRVGIRELAVEYVVPASGSVSRRIPSIYAPYLTTSVAAEKSKSSWSLVAISKLCFPVENPQYISCCKKVIHIQVLAIQKEVPVLADRLLGVRQSRRKGASMPNHPP